jgi:hypothetical protein
MFRGILSTFGFALAVFALLALSGPGRLDIVDGQTRFEVGRSLVEHGDTVIRDERVWWGVFPGRDGQPYTYYRLPQSLVAAMAIFVADFTGPVTEARRHFFFSLSSAVAGTLLALVYLGWFRFHELTRPRAMLWAIGGIVCTPAWFYSTSVFDDILGSVVVVAAVVIAWTFRTCRPLRGAILAGLLCAAAYHCKQPLGVVSLIVGVILLTGPGSRRIRFTGVAMVFAGTLAGVVTEKWYDFARFPFDKWVEHADYLKGYAPVYSGNPLPAMAVLLVSPGSGLIWFCPPVILGLVGLSRFSREFHTRRITQSILFAFGIFFVFISCLTFFKGDLAWGPRYFTPWFALFWLFVPWGVRTLIPQISGFLLVAGCVIQILALSVDHHRLFVEKEIPAGLGAGWPWLYFHSQANALLQRPREIREILADNTPAEAFSPAPSPTFAIDAIDRWTLPDPIPEHVRRFHIISANCRIPHEVAPGEGPAIVRRYHILNSLRPWWICFQGLPPEQRPVPPALTALLLCLSGGLGIGLLLLAKPAEARK